MGLDAGNALAEKAKKKTFGDTIRQIVNAGLLSPGLETRSTSLLSERNWLVHRSRADSRSAIHNDLSMHRLLTRLDAIGEETLSLLRKIRNLSSAYVKKHGVTEEYINKKAKELLEQWHASNTI